MFPFSPFWRKTRASNGSQVSAARWCYVTANCRETVEQGVLIIPRLRAEGRSNRPNGEKVPDQNRNFHAIFIRQSRPAVYEQQTITLPKVLVRPT